MEELDGLERGGMFGMVVVRVVFADPLCVGAVGGGEVS